MRDEVFRHLNRLNNKWKAVEQSINPNKVKSPSKDCMFNGKFLMELIIFIEKLINIKCINNVKKSYSHLYG